jgi:predicted  nucleic acid-binding Zn-ribbon protein
MTIAGGALLMNEADMWLSRAVAAEQQIQDLRSEITAAEAELEHLRCLAKDLAGALGTLEAESLNASPSALATVRGVVFSILAAIERGSCNHG